MLALPHHQSSQRAHMPIPDRAAQFAPFAALTGYGEAVRETARLTETRITLDEAQVAVINEQLAMLAQHLAAHWQVAITYFVPDQRKDGGAYLTDIGCVRKIDENQHLVVMESGMQIPMEEITEIQITNTEENQ